MLLEKKSFYKFLAVQFFINFNKDQAANLNSNVKFCWEEKSPSMFKLGVERVMTRLDSSKVESAFLNNSKIRVDFEANMSKSLMTQKV